MNILVTGGAGYIGSHTVVELIKSKHSVVIVDNFSNSSPEAVRRLEHITAQHIPLYEGDVQDRLLLDRIFRENKIDAAIHFAGLKAVGESVKKPLEYYYNNIGSTIALTEVMKQHGVKNLIFSSSATVYDVTEPLPWKETARTGIGLTNPYGKSKYMIEEILKDLVTSDLEWAITSLRYFNPIGAHESGLIGEDPNDIPNNLMPYIAQVAVGRLKELSVFGNDYDTPDGTGIRDYIHVVDLAKGHVAALEHLKSSGVMEVFNLGTGHGVSVLELVHAFERASGNPLPYRTAPRRAGDAASSYADATKARQELGWQTEKTIHDSCADVWRWQSRNPNGYESKLTSLVSAVAAA